MARGGGCWARLSGRLQQETLVDRPGASLRSDWVVGVGGSAPAVPSGRKWKGSQSSEGATELGFPRPVLWQMQGEAAGRSGEPSGDRAEASSEGLGGHHLLAQTDAHCPAGQQLCWRDVSAGHEPRHGVIFDHGTACKRPRLLSSPCRPPAASEVMGIETGRVSVPM